MSYFYLKVSCSDGVVRVTLSRPAVRNAFDAQLISELSACLKDLAANQATRILVLAAEGSMFCAGADFHWMGGLKDAGYDANYVDSIRLFEMFEALYKFPHPTIARVQGGAFGGGAGLVACCDFALMSEDATLSFSEVKIGLVPATISPFVIRKIGEGRAREVFLTGMTIAAARAFEIGLANRVVPSEALDSAVDEYVRTLLTCGPNAQSVTKQLLNEVPQKSLADAKKFTASIIATQRISVEGQEGMSAFLEKRKPVWSS
jgi:methylglutaconyl-CoA hydratase